MFVVVKMNEGGNSSLHSSLKITRDDRNSFPDNTLVKIKLYGLTEVEKKVSRVRERIFAFHNIIEVSLAEMNQRGRNR